MTGEVRGRRVVDESRIWMVPPIVAILVLGADKVPMGESDGMGDDGGVQAGSDARLDGML